MNFKFPFIFNSAQHFQKKQEILLCWIQMTFLENLIEDLLNYLWTYIARPWNLYSKILNSLSPVIESAKFKIVSLLMPRLNGTSQSCKKWWKLHVVIKYYLSKVKMVKAREQFKQFSYLQFSGVEINKKTQCQMNLLVTSANFFFNSMVNGLM